MPNLRGAAIRFATEANLDVAPDPQSDWGCNADSESEGEPNCFRVRGGPAPYIPGARIYSSTALAKRETLERIKSRICSSMTPFLVSAKEVNRW